MPEGEPNRESSAPARRFNLDELEVQLPVRRPILARPQAPTLSAAERCQATTEGIFVQAASVACEHLRGEVALPRRRWRIGGRRVRDDDGPAAPEEGFPRRAACRVTPRG